VLIFIDNPNLTLTLLILTLTLSTYVPSDGWIFPL